MMTIMTIRSRWNGVVCTLAILGIVLVTSGLIAQGPYTAHADQRNATV